VAVPPPVCTGAPDVRSPDVGSAPEATAGAAPAEDADAGDPDAGDPDVGDPDVGDADVGDADNCDDTCCSRACGPLHAASSTALPNNAAPKTLAPRRRRERPENPDIRRTLPRRAAGAGAGRAVEPNGRSAVRSAGCIPPARDGRACRCRVRMSRIASVTASGYRPVRTRVLCGGDRGAARDASAGRSGPRRSPGAGRH